MESESSCSSCRRFSFDEINRATDEFAISLGEGGFGKVYRGNIGGKSVAVKCMTSITEEGLASFVKEIDLLTACDQANIISLVGYCDEGDDHKMLVYEFMSNGSLYDYLFENQDVTPRLTVEQRLEICIGVAKGLVYLHSRTDFNIIHSDIKSDNILLDRNLVPKISDFGLSRARPVGPTASQVFTNNRQGTEGYLAPECYEPNYKVSRKTDVYAFGVVLLEVLCERQSIERLVMLAIPRIMSGELQKFTPQYVATNICQECVRECENLIRECLEIEPDKRPSMKQVMDRLQLALDLQNQNKNRDASATTIDDHHVIGSYQLPSTTGINNNEPIVLFYTSCGAVPERQEVCQEVRQILDTYGKRVDERDVYLAPSYRKQIKDIFGSYTLPQLFICGKYIGGEDEIKKLHWSGELRKKLDRLPKRDYPSFCSNCLNTRFVSLSWCPICCFWKTNDAIWITQPQKYLPKK